MNSDTGEPGNGWYDLKLNRTSFYYTTNPSFGGKQGLTILFHILIFILVIIFSFSNIHYEAGILVDTNVAVAHQK